MGEAGITDAELEEQEYLSLNRQLDDLDQALNQLERKSDRINEEAKQLLRDAKATRVAGKSADTATHKTKEEGGARLAEKDSNASVDSNTPNSRNSDMDTS